MFRTQAEIDIHYYSRWEIAAAKEQARDEMAFFVAVLSAVIIDYRYDFWLWDCVAFVAGWWFCIYGNAAKTAAAWTAYENRPTLD